MTALIVKKNLDRVFLFSFFYTKSLPYSLLKSRLLRQPFPVTLFLHSENNYCIISHPIMCSQGLNRQQKQLHHVCILTSKMAGELWGKCDGTEDWLSGHSDTATGSQQFLSPGLRMRHDAGTNDGDTATEPIETHPCWGLERSDNVCLAGGHFLENWPITEQFVQSTLSFLVTYRHNELLEIYFQYINLKNLNNGIWWL